MRPNWFVAFPVDGSFVLDLPPLPPAFRRFHPEDVHLTLSFLGACSEEAAQRGMAALRQELAAAPRHGLTVTLGQVVPMGPSGHYSALSALLEVGRAETERCMTDLRDLVSDAALRQREQRAAKAHVTLARPQRNASAERRAQGLAWANAQRLGGVQLRLSRLALYGWADDRRERLFRIATEVRLLD
jgi:2'-5' RNA ligase